MTQIAVFVGSLGSSSINQEFAHKLEALLPEGVTFKYANLQLPLFSVDAEADYPADATANKELVESSDGVLFITPEYNRSMPGVLKNAIDWASRPWGANSFDGKPAATAGVSISPLGTTMSQQHLKNVLNYLNTKLLGQPELYLNHATLYAEDGQFVPETREFLESFLATFVAHIEKNR